MASQMGPQIIGSPMTFQSMASLNIQLGKNPFFSSNKFNQDTFTQFNNFPYRQQSKNASKCYQSVNPMNSQNANLSSQQYHIFEYKANI
jgi:hypothetical protein